MIPPNDKNAVRNLFKTLRTLSALGMTIVLLAHTNKYYGDDGLPVFEGVGDIRADTDELIYLLPHAQADGTKIISTVPNKIRGEFSPTSFRIKPDRTIEALDKYVDVKAQIRAEREFFADIEDIKEIHEFLKDGPSNQKEIYTETSLTRPRAIKLLRTYRGKQWSEETRHKNAKYYQSLPHHKRSPSIKQ